MLFAMNHCKIVVFGEVTPYGVTARYWYARGGSSTVSPIRLGRTPLELGGPINSRFSSATICSGVFRPTPLASTPLRALLSPVFGDMAGVTPALLIRPVQPGWPPPYSAASAQKISAA